jgi:hypothetical protein
LLYLFDCFLNFVQVQGFGYSLFLVYVTRAVRFSLRVSEPTFCALSGVSHLKSSGFEGTYTVRP